MSFNLKTLLPAKDVLAWFDTHEITKAATDVRNALLEKLEGFAADALVHVHAYALSPDARERYDLRNAFIRVEAAAAGTELPAPPASAPVTDANTPVALPVDNAHVETGAEQFSEPPPSAPPAADGNAPST